MSALAYLLRHPQTWPTGFEWDFGNCHTCAMGLSYALWHDQAPTSAAWFGGVAELLAISACASFAIFVAPSLRSAHGLDAHDISPEMIADEIEQYVITHPACA